VKGKTSLQILIYHKLSGIFNLVTTYISPRSSSYINLISLYHCFKYLNFQKPWDKICDKNLPIKFFNSQKICYQMFLLRNKCKDHCACLHNCPKTPEVPASLEVKNHSISHSLNLMIPFDLPGRASHQFQALYLKTKLYVADLLIICTLSPPSQSL